MENKKRKLPTYIMIGGVLLIILWFNISYFNHRISSNPQSISEYNLSDDDIAPEAHPAVAGVFYNADTYQSDENSTSEQKTSLQRYCPKIIIVPHEGGRNASKIASGAYGRLEQCRAKIKNVFILAPAHKKSKNLFVPMGSTINTPLGDLPINQQIVSSLLKNKLFKSDISLFNRKNSLKIQLPFLQKTLKSFKIVPILYGMVEGDLIAQTLHNFFDTEGNLFVISADLAVLDNNKDSTLKAHNECNIIGVKTALSLSKEFGLVPQILDITNINRKEIRFDNNKMRGWRYEEVIEQKILYGTELYHNNIKNFVKHHREALIEIIKSSIKSAEKHKHYRINRKKFDNYLFNQGA